MGDRLRRLRLQARPRDAAARAVARAHRAGAVADLEWHDGRPVVASPRQILRRQLDRLAERGWYANIGSELEFILFRESYDQARAKRYRDLDPANPYNVDYSIFGTTIVEDVIRPIRSGMAGAGMLVEDSKGECNFGQHEVNFRYADALTMADDHAIYKNGAKEIAWQQGTALTFMAKYNEREGNSCHIHCSFWDGDGSLFPDAEGHGHSRAVPAVHRRPAGGTARADVPLRAERQLLQALRARLVRADRAGLGHRQPHVRVPRRRPRPGACALETRLAGRRRQPVPGVRRDDRGRPRTGSTTSSSSSPSTGATPTTPRGAHVPSSLRRGDRPAGGFGARPRGVRRRRRRPLPPRRPVELRSFEAAVTDWERFRGFERL